MGFNVICELDFKISDENDTPLNRQSHHCRFARMIRSPILIISSEE